MKSNHIQILFCLIQLLCVIDITTGSFNTHRPYNIKSHFELVQKQTEAFLSEQRCPPVRNLDTVTKAVVSLWNDEPIMKAYYQALSLVRRLLESVIPENSTCVSGFNAWPSPNPFKYRSASGIILEISITKQGATLTRLHTPFGAVKLIGGGLFNERLQISDKFIGAWSGVGTVIDLSTASIGAHRLQYGCESKIYPGWQYGMECHTNSGDVANLYLLHYNDQYSFSSTVNVDPKDLDIFLSCRGAGYYDQSRRMFSQASEGKNHF